MAKLLIVEDSATERDYLREILSRAGHAVLTAGSGREGVELAHREHPDLVFMDVVMEDMDGFHATRALKDALPHGPEVNAPDPSDAPAAPLDGDALQSDLQSLRDLLIHSNLTALDVHAALRKSHAAAARGQLEPLNTCMSALDFAQAVVECDMLLKDLQPAA
jgi:CheY-like chemotaxis protein